MQIVIRHSWYEVLASNLPTHTVDDRVAPTFIDPTDEGFKKMCTKNWLKDTMAKSHKADVHEEGDTEDINIDYEIYNTN